MDDLPVVADGAQPRRVTIRDVARHAGVSVPAVSKVLREAYGVSPAMRSRVQHSIAQLEYRPHASARGMRGKTFTIGVLVPDLSNPFPAVLVEAAAEVLKTAGYEIMVGPAGASLESNRSTVDALLDRQMDGLLLVSPLGSEEFLASVGSRIPTVVIGRHGPAERYDTIAGDDVLGARLVVEHLAQLGHQRIAFVSHAETPHSDDRLPQNVRLDGYRRSMADLGLSAEVDVIEASWTRLGGRDAARTLLSRSTLPSAVLGGPDVTALSLLSEFWLAGRTIPGDVSISGYDDSDTASYAPIGLTSVDQGGRQMGRIASEMLLERMGGRMEPRHDLIEPTLVRRRTTAPLARPRARA